MINWKEGHKERGPIPRQHTVKVVKPGRSFVSRMYSIAAKLKHLSHSTHLNEDFRSDLHWWNTSVKSWSWNGISLLHAPFYHATVDLTIQIDASGSWGCGALS